MTDFFIWSLLSGLATGVGGIISLFSGFNNQKSLSFLLGLAAGIGFVLVFLDMIPAAIEIAGTGYAALGFGGGIIFGIGLNVLLPHFHGNQFKPVLFCKKSTFLHNATWNPWKMACFLSFGIVLHNVPEGLAMGAGFEAIPGLGVLLALAIGAHNIPEGMTLTTLFQAAGGGKCLSLGIPILIGLFIPLGAYISMILTVNSILLSLFLGFGAGMLVYVVWKELLPISHKMHQFMSWSGIILGMLVSMVISFLVE